MGASEASFQLRRQHDVVAVNAAAVPSSFDIVAAVVRDSSVA